MFCAIFDNGSLQPSWTAELQKFKVASCFTVVTIAHPELPLRWAKKGSKNANCRVASPESVPNHLLSKPILVWSSEKKLLQFKLDKAVFSDLDMLNNMCP